MTRCPWCDVTFSDVESWEGHASERHGWLSEEDFECLEVAGQIDHEDHEGHDTPQPCTERKRKSSDSISESSLTEDEYEWLDMVEKIDYLNHGSPPCKKKKADSYDEFLQEIVESPRNNANPHRDTGGVASKIWRPPTTRDHPTGDEDSPPPDPENDEKRGLSYTFTKIGERRFKNSAIDRHYRVKFDLNADSEDLKLSHMYARLESMFDSVLREAAEGLQPSDLIRVIIHHGDLTNPVYVPLRPLSEMTGNDVLEYLQNVLNSHENLPLDTSFNLDVGTISLPRGGTKKTKIIRVEGPDNSLAQKRSIVEIINGDYTCLARAIGVGFVRAHLVTPQEWREATCDDQRPREEIIIDHKKCSRSHFQEMTRRTLRGENEHAKRLALAMCRRVNAPTDRQLNIRDIEPFENLLDVDILVISARMGNKFLRVPPENSKKKRIYLYLVGGHGDGHFHTIVNICGFFAQSNFCENCLKPYQNIHQCETSCFVCKTRDCRLVKETEVSCIKCHMTCRSLECYDRHLEVRHRKNKEAKSTCELFWKCKTCKRVVKTEKRSPEQHHCDEWLCRSCGEFVDKGHLCYVRATAAKERSSKFIFFDFECTQDDRQLSCAEGYKPDQNPDCTKCRDQDEPCTRCAATCTNCHQSWCGKFKHDANLVVAHSVCKSCEAEDVGALSLCETCGTRCKRCNAYDRETKQYVNTPCKDRCGRREVIFKGPDTATEFCRWLFDPSHKGFKVMAHNLKGYDGYFLLEYLISQSIRPNITYAGSKIMHMDVHSGLNMRILDTLNFLNMRLAQLPGAFDLVENRKGYFPHFFNKEENQHYRGPYPDPHYYGCDAMSTEDRDKFMAWHTERVESGDTFDFEKDILKYCRSDVDILRKAALAFRDMLLKITGTLERTLDEESGEVVERTVGGVDPFNEITIAGVCTKVFRTNFLTETWEVKLRKDGSLTDWLHALKRGGEMDVEINGERLDGQSLQDRDYVIEESRFVSSPLGQIPSCGYVARDNFSKISIQWLEWLTEKSRREGEPLHIRHALNEGEYCLPGTKYKLDGYAPPCKNHPEGTAFEFLGCLWHGCPRCFANDRKKTKTPRTKQSMDELLQLTTKKRAYIESLGMNYICIWEHEFHALLREDKTMSDFVASLNVQDRLIPREAFFGGRTNAIKLECKVKEGEKIRYADFTSLYPYINKYARYPIKHPQIITSDFQDISNYFGIAKIKVVPPRKLYHPVLPQRMNGKLTFCLCRTCAGSENHEKPCLCDDEDRALTGTWCTPEIMKAIEKGYKILKIYEVYHWEETSQYCDGKGGIFGAYIDLFLKIKQEASDWPDWVRNEDDERRYIEDYLQHEGIQLDRNNIKKNKALRSLAKLLLNSFWGKFGQRLNQPQTNFFHEAEADKYFQHLSCPHKIVKDFHIITDDMIQITWVNRDDMIEENMQTNVFIAAFTTCFARLKLYSSLEELQQKARVEDCEIPSKDCETPFDRCLYFDTDSVIYLSRPGDVDLQLGDYLGELTDELTAGDHITHFVGAGAKQYGYLTHLGKHTCKIRGFSLNYQNSKLLNFDSLRELMRTHVDDEITEKHVEGGRKKKKQKPSIPLTNPRKIARLKFHRQLYSVREEKQYRVQYTKRVIQKDFSTLPFGF